MIRNRIEKYFDRLWPLNRSLTGNGTRESIKILSELIPFEIEEVPSGTKCFDWTVPDEWNVDEAWIKGENGNEIVNFKNNNLHLLGYSMPVQKTLPYTELKEHLYSLPDQPDLIPYLVSYYQRRWGFCLSHKKLLKLDKSGIYNVQIKASFDSNGSMTIADHVLKGRSSKEVMLSTYICHPSMASNELSGPLVMAFVFDQLKERDLRYSYRFVLVPETIGAICYLSKYGNHLKKKLTAGFVVTTIGDDGMFTYKKSRRGDTLVDRATEIVLRQTEENFTLEEFSPIGSDERQYCSPGMNLPVGSLMRTRYGKYKEYHTSGDNKEYVSFEAMENSVQKYLEVIELIEGNFTYLNLFPNCEPQLGKRGLYSTLGSEKEKPLDTITIMWVLNLADGSNDIIQIIDKSQLFFKDILRAAELLEKHGLIKKVE